MAYIFFAEKHGAFDLTNLNQNLLQFAEIEVFPIEIFDDSISLGISVPLKAADEPSFERVLDRALRFLIVQEGFQVTDLYTGQIVSEDDISNVYRRMTG